MQHQDKESITPDMTKPLFVKTTATVVILSFVFGSLGGVFGAYYLFTNPNGQKWLPKTESEVIRQSIALTEESAVIDVVKKAGPAVVSIVVSKDLNKIQGYGLNPFFNDPFFDYYFGGQQRPNQSEEPNVQQVGAGSGFFVSGDGLILTNKHVVSDSEASYTVLIQDGKKYDAIVLARDPGSDLAIVKVEIKDAPFLNLSDSSKIQIGQRVVAIGNSLGLYQNTVTSGIVSGIGRSITAGSQDGSENLSGVIQTDAAINPGNSGGPLLNILGEVVGINTAIDRQGQLVGFAIPSNDARKALADFEKNGKITRPFLGVRYITITPDLAKEQKLTKDYGALLIRGQTTKDLAVLPGSPADKAGLMENDIILEVNGKKIGEESSLANVLKAYSVGDSIKLKVYHKGEEKTVTVILGESKQVL